MMRTLSFLLRLLLLWPTAVLAVSCQPTELSLTISEAWARPADMGGTSAVYLNLTNHGRVSAELVGISASNGMAALHETTLEGDTMRMRPLDKVIIPAGDTVAFAPGGKHIMLMGLSDALMAGETLSLTLQFASGQTVAVTAEVSQTAPDALTQQALTAVAQGQYVGQVVNPPVPVADFAQPSTHPDIHAFSDLNGQWRVIFFGYMHCPDFCPLTLVDYRTVKEQLPPNIVDDVTFIFISVDAIRDTPDKMEAYLANFDPAFVGFAPDDETLAHLQPSYGFYYQRRLDEGEQAIYTVDHSTRSYLVDPDGYLRASFAYDLPPQQIATALRWYIRHW